MQKNTNQQKKTLLYEQKNPQKAQVIKKAVKRGLKEYAETFRRLATT